MDNLCSLCEQAYDKQQQEIEYARNKNIEQNQRVFTLLAGFIDFCYEIGEQLDGFISTKEKPIEQFLELRFHETAIKIFLEAYILLQFGSASGAMGRWRVLYEFSVVEKFITTYPCVGKAYCDHMKVADYKYVRKLNEYKEELDIDNFNNSIYQEIEEDYNAVKQQYGKDFKKDYEWAREVFDDNEPINLFSLAQKVNMEKLYAYVDEAHIYNHTSARYIVKDRGTWINGNKYMFSPYGVELPMQLLAISLNEINCSLLKSYHKIIEDEIENLEKLFIYRKQSEEFVETILNEFNKVELNSNL